MKPHLIHANRTEHGSALVMALILGVVVGIVLASYLTLIQSRMYARARSFAWNSAVPVLEAGIEEGFTHLHSAGSRLNVKGWSKVTMAGGIKVYQRTRYFSDGSSCFVTISNAVAFPF